MLVSRSLKQLQIETLPLSKDDNIQLSCLYELDAKVLRLCTNIWRPTTNKVPRQFWCLRKYRDNSQDNSHWST